MKYLGIFLVGILVGCGLFFLVQHMPVISKNTLSPLGQLSEKPLEKYTFDNLRKRKYEPSDITFGKVVKDDSAFTSQMFYFKSDGRKVSGLMNVPKGAGVYPIIVMYRGFAPRETYTSGLGTIRTAEYFATQGFITLAPDFLGYGESDNAPDSSIEDRFLTYTTAISLPSSIPTINKTFDAEKSVVFADVNHVGIWGHSNGGHIALSVLAITGKAYPTVLWNPVSKPFPYSILYFTDEFDDNGKALRKVVAEFEKDYDTEKYSPTNYEKFIKAPIQLDQAVTDEEVPIRWSDELYKRLQDQGLKSTYYTYPEENHNFNNGSWPTIVGRSADFFKEHLSNIK